jgi:hypothetical protein
MKQSSKHRKRSTSCKRKQSPVSKLYQNYQAVTVSEAIDLLKKYEIGKDKTGITYLQSLTDKINNNLLTPDQDLFDGAVSMVSILNNSYYGGYYSNTPVVFSSISPFFTILLENYDILLSYDFVKMVVRFKPENLSSFLDIYLKKNKKFSLATTKILFASDRTINNSTHNYNYGYNYSNNNLFDSRIKELAKKEEYLQLFTFDDDVVELMFDLNLTTGMTYLINNKYTITPKCLKFCIENKNTDMFDVLLKLNITLDTQTLEEACRTGNLYIIKSILNNKISPSKLCLNSLLSITVNTYYTSRRSKYYGNNEKDDSLSNIKDCIDLLITCGYTLTRDELLAVTKKNIELNKNSIPAEFFNDSDFMNKITVVCNSINFFPYGIKPDKSGLISEIKKKGTLPSIKALIKTYKLDPNIICLQEACKHKSNTSVIRYLIENCKIKPDILCLKYTLLYAGRAQARYMASQIPDNGSNNSSSNDSDSSNNKSDDQSDDQSDNQSDDQSDDSSKLN